MNTANDMRALDALAEARAPRYTSYPTAVQFGKAVDAATYAGWLAALPNGEAVSVYVHVPFCRRLCWYCGCNMRVVNGTKSVTDYVQALDREIELVFWARGRVFPVSSLHLGGGSPDSLSPDDLDRLFASLRYAFHIPGGIEIAAELDPAHVSEAWIRAAARHGLNRASLGVQTFAPAVQAAVNRPQSFERVSEVVAGLRDARVGAINFDLMYGLPKQTAADIRATIDQALTLRPDRISVFGYAHVPNLKAHQHLIDPATLPGVAERMEQSQAAAERLIEAGYVRIGLDHFALPDDDMAKALAEGTLRRNFQGYTTDRAETLIGLGASAISKLPFGYAQNAADLNQWRAAIAQGRLPTARGVAFTGDDRLRADAIERLMCFGQVDLSDLCRQHLTAMDTLDGAWESLRQFEALGLVTLNGASVRATERGRTLIRTICTAFDRYYDPHGGRHSRAV